MEKRTILYSEKFSVLKIDPVETDIIVENIDCLIAAQKWKEKGYNVVVLNMANRQNPGGEVNE